MVTADYLIVNEITAVKMTAVEMAVENMIVDKMTRQDEC